MLALVLVLWLSALLCFCFFLLPLLRSSLRPSLPLFSSCFCSDYRKVGSCGVVPLAEAAATDCLTGSRVETAAAPVSVAFVKSPRVPEYRAVQGSSSDDAAAAVLVAGFTTCFAALPGGLSDCAP